VLCCAVLCSVLVNIVPHDDPNKSGLVPDHVDDLPVGPSVEPLVHLSAIVDPVADTSKVSNSDLHDTALDALADEVRGDDVQEVFHLPALPVGDLAKPSGLARALSGRRPHMRPHLLPIPANRLDEAPRVQESRAIREDRRKEHRLTQVHRHALFAVILAGPDLHHQTGLQTPGKLVVGDGDLPHPLVFHAGAVAQAKRDGADAILPARSQGERQAVALHLEPALDVLERGEHGLGPEPGRVVSGPSVALEGKKRPPRLPHLIAGKLHGHGVVALRPRKSSEDAVEVRPAHIDAAGVLLLEAQMPHQPVVDLCGTKHGISQDAFGLGISVDLRLDRQHRHPSTALVVDFHVFFLHTIMIPQTRGSPCIPSMN